MPWIEGDRTTGYRVAWRTGGRGSKVLKGPTYAGRGEAADELRARKEQQQADRRLKSAVSPLTPLPTLLDRWKASRIAGKHARADYCDEGKGLIDAAAKAQGWTRIADITSDSIDRWVTAKKGIGTATTIRVLKGFLRWAERTLQLRAGAGVLAIIPPRRAKRPPPPLLTRDQVTAILAEVTKLHQPTAVLCEHLALYGCRPIDLCRITVGNWHARERQIAYDNSKNTDTVMHPVHEEHAVKLDALAKDRDPSAFLFLDPWARPWKITRGSAMALSGWYYQNVGEHLLPKAQRGIYCLKDFAMTNLAQAAQGNRAAIVAMSGHRDTRVTDRYLATNAETQQRLLAAIAVPALTPTVPAPAAAAASGSTAGSTDPGAMQIVETVARRKRSPRKPMQLSA